MKNRYSKLRAIYRPHGHCAITMF